MSQVFFNIAAALVFVSLFYLEIITGIPLVMALVQSFPTPMEQQAALVCLIFNCGGAVVLSMFLTPFYKIVARGWSTTSQEEWSRTAFLGDEMADAPEVARTLLTREQARLMCFTVRYPEILQKPMEDEDGKVMEALHASFQTVSREIESHAAEIIKHPLDPEGLEILLIAQNKQKQMENLNDLLYQFTQTCPNLSGGLQDIFQPTFLQGLDFLLQTACEAENSHDPADSEHLLHLTHDKAKVFQSIRNSYLRSGNKLSLEDRRVFLDLTGLFERIGWTMDRIGKLQYAQKLLERSGIAE
ncbi:hypothetical protein OOT00_09535 [Desulfobotulus sp. H1]|uniref:PhoU domain-containing protein n=1 Tax=Desulfobotulus pelophilus TaxID=2823377 RepID=A0ABT3N9T6_9BACT|nr:hypothetical protein [Desulfobotulus pelophilus]MCW7754228.1 hypothetical protein [Desulfobotulus pelophilus]